MTAVFGVDFSGGAQAGRKIWLAEGVAGPEGLLILDVLPCHALPGSGVARDVCLPALRALMSHRCDATFGIDAPFGLHESLVDAPDWAAFVTAFGTRYPDPDAFRTHCRARSGGAERWRRTDREARVPFTGYNLRVYRQTFYALRDVFAPLLREDRIRVRPMQAPAPGKATVIEICPASTLKAEGLYRSYKAATAGHEAARREILGAIAARFAVRFASEAPVERLVADTEGDALDAVISACATARALAVSDAELADYHLEGFVYV